MHPDDLLRIVLHVVLDQLEGPCRVSFSLRLRLSEAYHAEFWGVEVCRQCSPCITEQVLYLFLALGSSALHARQNWRSAIRDKKRERQHGNQVLSEGREREESGRNCLHAVTFKGRQEKTCRNHFLISIQQLAIPSEECPTFRLHTWYQKT